MGDILPKMDSSGITRFDSGRYLLAYARHSPQTKCEKDSGGNKGVRLTITNDCISRLRPFATGTDRPEAVTGQTSG